MISQLLASSFVDILTYIGYIVLAICILLLMITIHELGHYTAGKIFKFKIDEFSIGFGKAIYKKTKKNGEIFSIRILPLGGYCAFAGEDTEVTKEGDFNSKPAWQRLIVQFSGVLFNFLSAIIFTIILLVSFGYDIPKITQIDSTGVNAHLQTGDIITEIDGVKIDFCGGDTFNVLLSQNLDKETVPITIERNGQTIYTYLNIETVEKDGQTYFNLGITVAPTPQSFWTALARAVPMTIEMAWQVLQFLFMLITGQVSLSGVTGPISTITTIASYTEESIANLFIFLPFIAVNLAVFNILPIPSLDGARMVFTTIEWIRGKPINRNIEAQIHFWGLMVLLVFVVMIDVLHFLLL